MNSQHLVKKSLLLFGLMLCNIMLTGCVRKMLHVTSEPSGAQLYVNSVYRGRTPVSVPFNWNWFYDLRLEAPGHDRFEIRERLYAPPRHVVGPDLIAEFMPWGSREDHLRHYQLNPTKAP
jgi:hypothetical protein